MKDFLKRSGWIFLAVLFLVTALGVGVLAFWQATHPPANQPSNTSQSSQAPTCTNDSSIAFNAIGPKSTKLAGTQLSDFTPLAHLPALTCTDVKVGTGQAIQSSSTITANYTGAIAATGVIFQSSLDNNGQPFTAALSGVIPGWQTGLLGMKSGGERRLLIPSAEAYGATGSCETQDAKDPTKCDKYSIPPNADLVFDVTVIQVQ